MKNLILFLAIGTLITSCTDKKNGPEITLIGDELLIHPLNLPFEDPGFAAYDNEDGVLTEDVDVDGTVDVNLVGDYLLTYTVKDKHDNDAKPMERTVRVYNQADFLDGYYMVSSTITYATNTATSTTGNTVLDDVQSSTTLNNRFFVQTHPIYCDLVGSLIGIPLQSVNTVNYSGNGFLGVNNSIELNVTRNESGLVSMHKLVYIKQ